MKTFERTSLPETIKYNGRLYCNSVKRRSNSVRVNVLSSRLKGVCDMHGHLYNPTSHYFSPAIMYTELEGSRVYYHSTPRDLYFSGAGLLYIMRNISGPCVLCPVLDMDDKHLDHKSYGKTDDCRRVLQLMDRMVEPDYTEALRVVLKDSDRLRDCLESELNLYI